MIEFVLYVKKSVFFRKILCAVWKCYEIGDVGVFDRTVYTTDVSSLSMREVMICELPLSMYLESTGLRLS